MFPHHVTSAAAAAATISSLSPPPYEDAASNKPPTYSQSMRHRNRYQHRTDNICTRASSGVQSTNQINPHHPTVDHLIRADPSVHGSASDVPPLLPPRVSHKGAGRIRLYKLRLALAKTGLIKDSKVLPLTREQRQALRNRTLDKIAVICVNGMVILILTFAMLSILIII